MLVQQLATICNAGLQVLRPQAVHAAAPQDQEAQAQQGDQPATTQGAAQAPAQAAGASLAIGHGPAQVGSLWRLLGA